MTEQLAERTSAAAVVPDAWPRRLDALADRVEAVGASLIIDRADHPPIASTAVFPGALTAVRPIRPRRFISLPSAGSADSRPRDAEGVR